MKKRYTFLLMITVLAVACNSGTDEANTKTGTKTDGTAVTTDDLSSNPVYQAGLAIEVKQDCATCHRVDSKIIGPSYREVANKYASQPDTAVNYLANKIITGGSGVWGSDVMTPHPNLSKEDAEALVRYIFLLKNN
jgi:cytochrome c